MNRSTIVIAFAAGIIVAVAVARFIQIEQETPMEKLTKAVDVICDERDSDPAVPWALCKKLQADLGEAPKTSLMDRLISGETVFPDVKLP